jgi:hypothetical protein
LNQTSTDRKARLEYRYELQKARNLYDDVINSVTLMTKAYQPGNFWLKRNLTGAPRSAR